jgi:hypothetical protein
MSRKKLAWGLVIAAISVGCIAFAGGRGAFSTKNRVDNVLEAPQSTTDLQTEQDSQPASVSTSPPTQPESAPTPAESQAAESARNAESDSTEIKSDPKSTNCYDNNGLSFMFKETAKTREDFAVSFAESLRSNDIRDIDVVVAGHNQEYLLVFSTPEDALDLRKIICL